jgi:predicted nucleic acid-binding protein
MKSGWNASLLAMLDTNVLIYAHDTTNPVKQATATW